MVKIDERGYCEHRKEGDSMHVCPSCRHTLKFGDNPAPIRPSSPPTISAAPAAKLQVKPKKRQSTNKLAASAKRKADDDAKPKKKKKKHVWLRSTRNVWCVARTRMHRSALPLHIFCFAMPCVTRYVFMHTPTWICHLLVDIVSGEERAQCQICRRCFQTAWRNVGQVGSNRESGTHYYTVREHTHIPQ